jgi:hypothetical protein
VQHDTSSDVTSTDSAATSAKTWWSPWPVLALIVVTVANYVWQIPYYQHFYGVQGHAPDGLWIPLVLTFLWFLAGTWLLVTRRRGGAPVLASFLVVEAAFYVGHNLSGAAGKDLPTHDPVLFIASTLGYVNLVAAVLFLLWLRRHRRSAV